MIHGTVYRDIGPWTPERLPTVLLRHIKRDGIFSPHLFPASPFSQTTSSHPNLKKPKEMATIVKNRIDYLPNEVETYGSGGGKAVKITNGSYTGYYVGGGKREDVLGNT